MPTRRHSKADHDFDRLQQDELELWQRSKELEERQRQLSIQRKEDEATLPPLPDILDIKKTAEYEIASSRGEIKNLRKEQSRNFFIMLLFLAATITTAWWAWTIWSQS